MIYEIIINIMANTALAAINDLGKAKPLLLLFRTGVLFSK